MSTTVARNYYASAQEWAREQARCRDCRAPVVWTSTWSGQRVPIDKGTASPGTSGGWVGHHHANVCKRSKPEQARTRARVRPQRPIYPYRSH